MLPRQKRRGGGGGGQAANKIVNAVYHKLTELVETMAILLETQPLTDTTVLLVWDITTYGPLSTVHSVLIIFAVVFDGNFAVFC